MPNYVLLLTLTPEGRTQMVANHESLRRAEAEIKIPGVQTLGLYAVLGRFDFVSIIEAEHNDAVASFSLELGVRGGVHVETLPAIPVSLLEDALPSEPQGLHTEGAREPFDAESRPPSPAGAVGMDERSGPGQSAGSR